MKRFLRECVRDLPEALTSKNIHIVIGNEASDADSIVSALTYAYYLHQKRVYVDQPSLFSFPVDGKSSLSGYSVPPSTHIIPLLSIESNDINIRPDVKLIFEKIGLLHSEVMSLKDFVGSYSSTVSKSSISVTLVDHNSMSSAMRAALNHALEACQTPLSGEVIATYHVANIIDHHKDQLDHIDANVSSPMDKSYLPVLVDAVPNPLRHIAYDNAAKKETAGSCCSLVLEEFQSNAIGISLLENCKDVITSLLCVLLLDTCNLNPSRTAPRDHLAMEYLVRRYIEGTPSADTSSVRDALYAVLSGAKSDPSFWGQLSIMDVLRLDYKLFPVLATVGYADNSLRVGISSIMIPMTSFFHQGDVIDESRCRLTSSANVVSITQTVFDAVLQKMKDNDLCGYVVTTFFSVPTPEGLVYHREVCMFFPSDCEENGTIRDKMLLYCANHGSEFRFEEVDVFFACCDDNNGNRSTAKNVLYYRQNNVGLSRKQLAPLLQNFGGW
jgi:exopolyphosphatase